MLCVMKNAGLVLACTMLVFCIFNSAEGTWMIYGDFFHTLAASLDTANLVRLKANCPRNTVPIAPGFCRRRFGVWVSNIFLMIHFLQYFSWYPFPIDMRHYVHHPNSLYKLYLINYFNYKLCIYISASPTPHASRTW